MLFTCQR